MRQCRCVCRGGGGEVGVVCVLRVIFFQPNGMIGGAPRYHAAKNIRDKSARFGHTIIAGLKPKASIEFNRSKPREENTTGTLAISSRNTTCRTKNSESETSLFLITLSRVVITACPSWNNRSSQTDNQVRSRPPKKQIAQRRRFIFATIGMG